MSTSPDHTAEGPPTPDPPESAQATEPIAFLAPPQTGSIHRAARSAPVPPEPEDDDPLPPLFPVFADPTSPTGAQATLADSEVTNPTVAGPSSPDFAATPAPITDDGRPGTRRSRRPRRGGAVRVLLGMVIGLVVGTLGVWLVVFGQSRVLGAQAPQWDASFDPLGILLTTAGVLVLACVAALGAWSTAAPVTAGTLATAIGVVYLYVPATSHDDLIRWFATDATRTSVTRAVVTATSGTVFVIGALLLAAGLTLWATERRRSRI